MSQALPTRPICQGFLGFCKIKIPPSCVSSRVFMYISTPCWSGQITIIPWLSTPSAAPPSGAQPRVRPVSPLPAGCPTDPSWAFNLGLCILHGHLIWNCVFCKSVLVLRFNDRALVSVSLMYMAKVRCQFPLCTWKRLLPVLTPVATQTDATPQTPPPVCVCVRACVITFVRGQ